MTMTLLEVLDECKAQRNVAINEANKLRDELKSSAAERDAARAEVERLAAKLNDLREELFELQRDA